MRGLFLRVFLLFSISFGCYLGLFSSSPNPEADSIAPVPMSVSDGFTLELHATSLHEISSDKLHSGRLRQMIGRLQEFFVNSRAKMVRIRFAGRFIADVAESSMSEDLPFHSQSDGITVRTESSLELSADEARLLREFVSDLEVLIGDERELYLADLYYLRAVLCQAKFSNRLVISTPDRKWLVHGQRFYVKDRLSLEMVSRNRVKITGLYVYDDNKWQPADFVNLDGKTLNFEKIPGSSERQRLQASTRP